jgi:hypothetical protein
LWEAYLGGFAAPEERQHHTCSACRQFIKQYGGLAVVGETGRAVSALWTTEVIDAAPLSQQNSLEALADAVSGGKIVGFFLTSHAELGSRRTGDWQHLALAVPPARLHTGKVLTAFQRAAEKNEEFRTVSRILGEFTVEQFATVVAICQSEAMYQSEKILGQARFLHELKLKTEAAPKPWRRNLVWEAVGLAPSGFCHPRSSMIGTVLDDIAAGNDFATIKRNFDAKMHPLRYQRPTAAPAAATIQQAEEVVAKLGIAPSLQRRYATLADVTSYEWQPPATAPKELPTSVFGHLIAKGAPTAIPLVIQGPPTTWAKFSRDVLPKAEEIKVALPRVGTFITFTTAVDADAPPILQWDREDARNPVAWYVWHGGSSPEQYGLRQGWADVLGITRVPCHWNPEVPIPHQTHGRVFLIGGGRETRKAGLSLFPSTLRSELHGVRSVIESFSNKGVLGDVEGDHAMGLLFNDHAKVTVRVVSQGLTTDYTLDRWE